MKNRGNSYILLRYAILSLCFLWLGSCNKDDSTPSVYDPSTLNIIAISLGGQQLNLNHLADSTYTLPSDSFSLRVDFSTAASTNSATDRSQFYLINLTSMDTAILSFQLIDNNKTLLIGAVTTLLNADYLLKLSPRIIDLAGGKNLNQQQQNISIKFKVKKEDPPLPNPPPLNLPPIRILGDPLEGGSFIIEPGDKVQLKAEIPSPYSSSGFRWASSDASILEIDANGILTAKKQGNATVYASTSDGLKGSLSLQIGHSYTSKDKYTLNIVYVVPRGQVPYPGFRKRMSKAVLAIREFYAKWFEHYGYGKKYFGLKTADVDGTTIADIKLFYVDKDYSSNLNNRYDSANSMITDMKNSLKIEGYQPTSLRYLIVNPWHGGFALGIFALTLDIKEQSDPEAVNNNVGAMAHELGHAFLLGHNIHKYDEYDKYGTSLMSYGNQIISYDGISKAKAFLTKYDVDIMRLSELYTQSDPPPTFFSSIDPNAPHIRGSYDTTRKIYTITGKLSYVKYPQNNPIYDVYKVYVFMGPTNPENPDADSYKMAAWEATIDERDSSFSVTIPRSDFAVNAPSWYFKLEDDTPLWVYMSIYSYSGYGRHFFLLSNASASFGNPTSLDFYKENP